MKILVVDDDAAILGIICEFLVDEGHEPIAAKNGMSALNIFAEQREHLDLVLLDVLMPKVNGLEVLRRIRKDDEDLPVVIMTGHDELETAVSALRHGAFDLLKKPFQFQAFLEALERLANLKAPMECFRQSMPQYQETSVAVLPSRLELVQSTILRWRTSYDSICRLFRINSNHMQICLMEAITNAVVHGNLQVESSLREQSWDAYDNCIAERERDPTFGDKTVTLRTTLFADRIRLQVEDQGEGVDRSILETKPDPANFLVSGRGIMLIRQFMDEVNWNEAGNIITMEHKYRTQAPPE